MCVNYINRTYCFLTKYFRFQSQCLSTCSNTGSSFANGQYCVSKTIFLMSGDVEFNPGPSMCEKNDEVRTLSIRILELRLNQFGLSPLHLQLHNNR